MSRSCLAAFAAGALALLAHSNGAKASETPAWTFAGSLGEAREAQASVVSGGRWYVGGGDRGATPGLPTTVEVYDPAVAQWQPVAGKLGAGAFPQAVAFSDAGGVMFIGGLRGGPSDEVDVADGMGGWSISHMTTPRFAHAAAIAGERVVVTGGWTNLMLDSAEGAPVAAFGPDGGAGPEWTSMGKMPGGARVYHTMTTLADGHHVLVVGGCMSDRAVASADLLDVATGVWSKAAAPHDGRCLHRASLLADGRVLITGATNIDRPPSMKAIRTAEIYDPASDSWIIAAPMISRRYDHAQVTLPDGRVLVAGGSDADFDIEDSVLSSTEIYDPRTDAWSAGPPLNEARALPSAAVLSDGVYVAGGAKKGGVVATRSGSPSR